VGVGQGGGGLQGGVGQGAGQTGRGAVGGELPAGEGVGRVVRGPQGAVGQLQAVAVRQVTAIQGDLAYRAVGHVDPVQAAAGHVDDEQQAPGGVGDDAVEGVGVRRVCRYGAAEVLVRDQRRAAASGAGAGQVGRGDAVEHRTHAVGRVGRAVRDDHEVVQEARAALRCLEAGQQGAVAQVVDVDPGGVVGDAARPLRQSPGGTAPGRLMTGSGAGSVTQPAISTSRDSRSTARKPKGRS
jgi:hypothetical protein